jgi:hypothetical protein
MLGVVDVKNFISLLRSASEDWRRSYDSKTSKTAREVEFWGEQKQHRNKMQPSSSTSFRRSLSFSDAAYNRQGRVQQSTKQWPSSNASTDQQSPTPLSSSSVSTGNSIDDLASLLGRTQLVHKSVTTKGRNVVGGLSKEMTEDVGGTVAAALNSPVRALSSKSPYRQSTLTQSTNNFYVGDFFSGNQMKNLLTDRSFVDIVDGGKNDSGSGMGRSCSRSKPHTLQREYERGKTTVSEALRGAIMQ